MKIVVDTNVFVSSFLGGNPRRVVHEWIEGNVTLCLSAPLLDEYVRVFEELDFLQKQPTREIIQLLEGKYNLVFCHTTPDLKVVGADPADDKCLECGVELGAEAIVSGDSDLLDLERYGSIRILSPADFLDEFVEEQE